MKKLILLLFTSITTNVFADNIVNECDRLAADPLNIDNPSNISGVEWNNLDSFFAIIACKSAIEENKNNPRYQFQLGRSYDNAENYSQAFIWYQKAAEQGYANAQYNLGLKYEDGKGVAKSDAEAVKWYRKSAEQGYAIAQYNLGEMHYFGKGVAKSDTEAVKWYRKAAEQNDAQAQYSLGGMHHYGKGAAKSDAEAVKWYRKAAEQDHSKAQFNLAIMYENGEGVVQNKEKAFYYYEKAAKIEFIDKGCGNREKSPKKIVALYLTELKYN